MTLFVLRLRNGNCVVVAAGDDAAARQRAKDLRADVEIATVRELDSFAAQFLLTDGGELKSILLDEQTLADLRAHEYPILNSARTQSYADFNYLRPTARLNMSSTMLSHKSILTHGMTATSAWFLTPSGRSVTG